MRFVESLPPRARARGKWSSSTPAVVVETHEESDWMVKRLLGYKMERTSICCDALFREALVSFASIAFDSFDAQECTPGMKPIFPSPRNFCQATERETVIVPTSK